MSRLFGKEYHEQSSAWYFKNVVIKLDREDLIVNTYLDERNQIIFSFEAPADKFQFFPAKIRVNYSPETQSINSHVCSDCRDDNCNHYLSILNYAYQYLTTDMLTSKMVHAYQGSLLGFNEQWQQVLLNSYISIADIYNTEEDKIRFYFNRYSSIDIRLIAIFVDNDKLSEIDPKEIPLLKQQIKAFSDAELEIIRCLNRIKCAFSKKKQFYTIYKSSFVQILPLLKALHNKLYIHESGDRLLFTTEEQSVNFYVEQIDPYNFLIRPNIQDTLSAIFVGHNTFLFKKNVISVIQLPFEKEIIEQIFSGGYPVKRTDLVYLASVVSKQLSLYHSYLDFDERIELPDVFDTAPQVTFRLNLVEASIYMYGSLAYHENGSSIEIPMSLVFYQADLIRYDLNNNPAWFYIPPQLKDKIFRFLERLPHVEANRIHEESLLVFSDQVAIEELKKIIFELQDPDWNFILCEELKKEFIYRVDLQPEIIASSHDQDWFSYEIVYHTKDVSLSHEELKKYFRSGEKFLRLKDGRLLFITNKDVFNELDHLVIQSQRSSKKDIYHLATRKFHFLYQMNFINQNVLIHGDNYLDEMIQAILTRKTLDKPEIPKALHPVLRSYQKAGFYWIKMLQRYHFSGILADDMGLGKTLEAITYLTDLPNSAVSLIICPKTLLFNWAAELEKFNPSLTYIIYEGSKEERKNLLKNIQVNLVIASYTLIQNDLEDLQKLEFESIILDEAQHIKNSRTLRSKAIKKLKCRFRLAMTGTPMENSPMELWSIFDFLMPGYLPSQRKFYEEFVKDSNINDIARTRLTRYVTPFILRRKKSEVLIELPDKQEQTVFCKMTPLQEKLYLQIIERIQNQLLDAQNKSINYLHILAALMKLRQICNHPHLIEPRIKKDVIASGKLELLQELIIDSMQSGAKILIFSQFVEMLKLIREMLNKHHIIYEYMDGETKNRQKPVENFNNNEMVRVFLISLKTGGYGLNLTAADTVILVDPWWNPMAENQAVDRAYRIGQTKKVNVYRMITKGTVEEKIMLLQKNKKEMFDFIIDAGQNILHQMSVDEVKQLFDYHAEIL